MAAKRGYAKVLLDKERMLRYDFNVIADVEEYYGKGIGKVLSEDMLGLNTLRVMYYFGLKWEDKKLTLPKVGTILGQFIADGGETEYLYEKLQIALQQSGILGMGNEEEEEPKDLNDDDEDEEEEDPNL